MKFKAGRLYEVKQFCWMLYPTKEAAEDAQRVFRATGYSPRLHISTVIKYWSKKLNCKVSYIPEKTLFHVVSQKKARVHIISPEGCGWLCIPPEDWTSDCFEELTEENCHET